MIGNQPRPVATSAIAAPGSTPDGACLLLCRFGLIRSGGGHNLQGVRTPARLLAQATFLASRGRHVEDAAWLALAIGAAASLATSFWL